MPASILVVDDESTITDALQLLLSDHGYDVIAASSAKEAETLLARRWFDLVFLDLRLPDADGIDLLKHIKHAAPEIEVVLMTAHGSLEMRSG
jgi:DNA-binding NtrC family response regulator